MGALRYIYDVKFPDGHVVQFGSARGIGTVADQIRMALPTATHWKTSGRKVDTEWSAL